MILLAGLPDILREAVRRGAKLRRQGSEFVGPCLRCRDGDDRFAINIRNQQWNCRGCKEGGCGAISLAPLLDDCSIAKACESLGGKMPSVDRSDKPTKVDADDYHRRQRRKANW